MPKPCPPEVLAYAGRIFNCRLTGYKFRDQLLDLENFAQPAIDVLMGAGALEMEFAAGRRLLNQAMEAPFLISDAHLGFRNILVAKGFKEPSLRQLQDVINSIITPMGGGGGGRGGGR